MSSIGIIGSPKTTNSASKHLLEMLNHNLKVKITSRYHFLDLIQENVDLETILTQTTVIILSFPLYVDGVPGDFLECLETLEKHLINKPKIIKVYTLINAGYFEGEQTEHAMANVRHWCKRSGLIFSGGIGIGAGSLLAYMPSKEGSNLKKKFELALFDIALHIDEQSSFDIRYVSPNMPRFIYRYMGNRMWYKAIKRNNLPRKSLYLKR